MRLLLMCDGSVGNTIAEWLIEHYSTDLAAVVTVAENFVSTLARDQKVPTIVFDAESSLQTQLQAVFKQDEICFDLGILAWWPKLISSDVIALANKGFINTHPSLLPFNRGKHYNFWALVEEAPFGVSLHFVDEGIDSGDIVAQQSIAYDWEDTGETLYSKAGEAMIKLFKSSYPQIRSGNIKRTPQDTSRGSLHYASEIDAASKIDLDRLYTARELLNVLRARTFPGHPACRFSDDGEVYEISVNIKRKSI